MGENAGENREERTGDGERGAGGRGRGESAQAARRKDTKSAAGRDFRGGCNSPMKSTNIFCHLEASATTSSIDNPYPLPREARSRFAVPGFSDSKALSRPGAWEVPRVGRSADPVHASRAYGQRTRARASYLDGKSRRKIAAIGDTAMLILAVSKCGACLPSETKGFRGSVNVDPRRGRASNLDTEHESRAIHRIEEDPTDPERPGGQRWQRVP